MPHIKNEYRYKNIVEVEHVHSGRFGKHMGKVERKKPTPEEMEKINERNVIKKLRRKIHANFEPEDLWITLTYRRVSRPSVAEAQKELKRFISKMRSGYRKAGIPLRYIVVTEYMNKSIHHHLILNDLPDGTGAKLAARKWTMGGIHTTYLYEEGGYELLAAYIVKETNKHFRDPGNPAKCRYSCSRNLKEPKKETKILKRDDWPEDPVIPKEYTLDKPSLWNGINKLGYRYQYFRMIRLNPKKEKKHGSKERNRKNHKKRNAGT